MFEFELNWVSTVFTDPSSLEFFSQFYYENRSVSCSKFKYKSIHSSIKTRVISNEIIKAGVLIRRIQKVGNQLKWRCSI